MTKQHVLPDRLKRILPRNKSERTNLLTRRRTDDFRPLGQFFEETRTRPGDPGSHQLRIVCRACNGGWLERAEANAFPFLDPIILGNETNLEVAAQMAVALVACTMSVMIEWTDRRSATATIEDRQHLAISKTPPPYWYVFVARIPDHQMVGTYKHNELILHGPGSPTEEVSAGHRTTILLGKCLLHVVSNPPEIHPMFDVGAYAVALGLTPIHPATGTLYWTEIPALGENQANEVCDSGTRSSAQEPYLITGPLAAKEWAMRERAN